MMLFILDKTIKYMYYVYLHVCCFGINNIFFL